jgi:CubicO group peptidase (beta-lactamase class C family)
MKRKLSNHGFLVLKLTVFLSLTVVIQVSALAQTNGQADTVSAQVDKVFAQWDKPNSPGCALAVIKDGNIIYKRGYGMANLDHDIPISPSSVFHVASVSKQFTAMAIDLLAKQGKLTLDDEVKKYIPELPDFGDKITVRHLLHHTSGLRDQWNLLIMAGWRLSEDVVKDEDVLDLVSRQKALNFKPGDQHLYSNTGYTLLAIIVKRVSGQSLREFAEANIFKPLGMNSTFFRDDHLVVVKNQAYGYSSAGQGVFKLSVPNYDTVGASSLLTTVEDLAKWDQNFYDMRIGGKEVLEQMQIPATLNNGDKIEYAHGLVVSRYKGLRSVGHGGADAGYRSNIMSFPEQRFSVACICNVANINPTQLSRQVADIYLKDQLKPEAPKTNPAVNTVTLTEQQLKSKVGVYWNPTTDDLARVTLLNGKLHLSAPGANAELLPLSETRFQAKEQPTEVAFESRQNAGAMQLKIIADGRKPVVFEAVEGIKPTTTQLTEYAGAYYSAEIDSVYQVEIDGDKLVLKRKKYKPVAFLPVFKDAFTNVSLGVVRFTRDNQNRINGFIASSGRIRNFRFSKQIQ